MDLISGYSQGGAPSEGSTQTLGQAARDIYRGLINPQQLQEVQRATQRTQKVIPSVLESLARGSIAQVPGTAGDISALLRQLSPETMQQLFGNRLAPTTDEILGYVPRMTPNYQGSESHEMMGGLLSPALGYFAKAIPTQMKGMPIGNMIAYHGTPHEIQGGFDMAKIGTGEGAQAYGHGMYFAENPQVAEAYKNLAKPNEGNLYKVDIPDEYLPTMVEWDKQLKDQPKFVKNFVNKYKKELTADMHEWMPQSKNDNIWDRMRGIDLIFWANELYGKEKAAKFLDSEGIKGIKYFDEQSRKAKKGTSNYVIFEPQKVKILEKNSKKLGD